MRHVLISVTQSPWSWAEGKVNTDWRRGRTRGCWEELTFDLGLEGWLEWHQAEMAEGSVGPADCQNLACSWGGRAEKVTGKPAGKS